MGIILILDCIYTPTFSLGHFVVSEQLLTEKQHHHTVANHPTDQLIQLAKILSSADE